MMVQAHSLSTEGELQVEPSVMEGRGEFYIPCVFSAL